MEYAAHNEKIEKAAAAREEWVKLPMQVIARTTGEFSDMRSRTIEMTAPTADGADSLTVIVISDGYLDDSVRGEKFKYELKANEQGVWKFTSASKAWRCQPGRGHQDYSTTKCSQTRFFGTYLYHVNLISRTGNDPLVSEKKCGVQTY